MLAREFLSCVFSQVLRLLKEEIPGRHVIAELSMSPQNYNLNRHRAWPSSLWRRPQGRIRLIYRLYTFSGSLLRVVQLCSHKYILRITVTKRHRCSIQLTDNAVYFRRVYHSAEEITALYHTTWLMIGSLSVSISLFCMHLFKFLARIRTHPTTVPHTAPRPFCAFRYAKRPPVIRPIPSWPFDYYVC